jgi:hypothetical protein
MWRRVDLVRTDISVERVASIFRVEKIRELIYLTTIKYQDTYVRNKY